jgi:hypothetical protein
MQTILGLVGNGKQLPKDRIGLPSVDGFADSAMMAEERREPRTGRGLSSRARTPHRSHVPACPWLGGQLFIGELMHERLYHSRKGL